MSLHRCTETECPFIGQTTSRSCRCHKTDEEVLRDIICEMLAADDAILAFILAADLAKMSDQERNRQHDARAARRIRAVEVARAAVK